MNAKLFLGPVLLLLADLGHAQQDFSKVDIKTIHVAKKDRWWYQDAPVLKSNPYSTTR